MRSDIFTVIDDLAINITNVNGKTIDISKLMLSIELYESIFEFFLSGKLTIADTLDLPQNFPIIGNETLELVISTTDASKTIQLNFKIYKINRDLGNIRGDVKRKILSIYFCSNETILNNISKISKKYSSKSENIIQDLLSNNLQSSKQFDYDISTSSVDVYSNFWTPSKIIDYLCKISKTSNYSDYIFFENLNGFVYKPISSIINEDVIHNIIYDTSTDSFIGNNNIKIFTFNKYFDILLNAKNGSFGKTYYTPHDSEYSFEKTEIALDDAVNEIVNNGLNLFFENSLLNEDNYVAANYYEPNISKIRTLSLKLFENYNLVIKLNGDFERVCGDNLSLDFPNYDNESSIHSLYNGNWLILGIKHIISQTNVYEQNLLLGKNAFFNVNNFDKIQSLKKI